MSHTDPTQLNTLADELLATAASSHARRAGAGVYAEPGGVLRQVVTALLAGAELAEHEAPPEATLQVLRGSVRLNAPDRSWELGAGELIAIPQARHSVQALEDSVFLLTVVHATAS